MNSEVTFGHRSLATTAQRLARYAVAEKTMGLESLVALVAAVGSFSTCLTAATFQNDPSPMIRYRLAG